MANLVVELRHFPSIGRDGAGSVKGRIADSALTAYTLNFEEPSRPP
jgi:hypothetical protein